MLTTSKQIMAYPGLRLPKGYLVATTGVYTPEPSSEYYTPPVTSLCYGLCHTNSSFNLSGERRRTSYPMERSLDERHPQDWLLFDHTTKENACLCIRRRTFTRNRVWQKDNRRCKLMVYTERRCTPLWAQKLMLHKLYVHIINIVNGSFYNIIFINVAYRIIRSRKFYNY